MPSVMRDEGKAAFHGIILLLQLEPAKILNCKMPHHLRGLQNRRARDFYRIKKHNVRVFEKCFLWMHCFTRLLAGVASSWSALLRLRLLMARKPTTSPARKTAGAELRVFPSLWWVRRLRISRYEIAYKTLRRRTRTAHFKLDLC